MLFLSDYNSTIYEAVFVSRFTTRKPWWSLHRVFPFSCSPQVSLSGHIKGLSLSPPIPNFLFLHPLSSRLTRMYLRTDFNKRAEILLKLSKEQVTGKEFELIDIILVVAPDV